MLGEMLGELHGKITGTRVLPGDDYRYVKMENSWEERGQVLGMEVMNTGTVEIFERVPGQIYGSGRGIAQTADGEGAIWNGHGVGRMSGDGMATTFAFSIAFQAGGKFARLNEVLVVGEQEIDAEGNVTTRLWEWK